MPRKTTTVRMPEELAQTAEVVARTRGISVNALVINALVAEIERVRQDKSSRVAFVHLLSVTRRSWTAWPSEVPDVG